MNQKALSYKKAGVDYQRIDPLKVLAQKEARKTVVALKNGMFPEVTASRGESAYVIEDSNAYWAMVEEGLGSKSLVADRMRQIGGKSYYDCLAWDTVAMMVNDLITVGAKPVVILAYWAAGSLVWFKDQERMKDLVYGWRQACSLAGAVWGGGETPILTGIIKKKAIDLAGACFGMVKPKKRLTLGDKLTVGDAIVLLESSGIHANGLTLARKIAQKLPQGLATRMATGEMFGEALLKPTIIYAKLIENLFKQRVNIHYMVNITGHGWRKLMRHKKSFTYRIHALPPLPPLLQFMVERGPITQKEAYSTLNMGAGFAIFVPPEEVKKTLLIAGNHKIKAYDAGVVENGKKRVIIEPKNIVFEEKSLQIRD